MVASNETSLVKDPEDWQVCREVFVAMIKLENFYGDKFCRQSLRADWTGPKAGFHDRQTQDRWLNFKAGWEACRKSHATNPRSPAVITGCIKK